MKNHNHAHNGTSVLAASASAILLSLLLAVPAYAASDLNTVIDSVRDWVAGLLIALATLNATRVQAVRSDGTRLDLHLSLGDLALALS